MFCKKCGKQIDNDSDFCRYCGADQNALNDECVPRAKKKAPAGIISLALAAMVIVAVLVFLFTGAPKAAESTPSNLSNSQERYEEQVAKLSDSVLLLNIYDRDHNLFKTGSGFVLFDDSTLVTNFHVIKDAYYVEAVDNADISYTIDGAKSYDVAGDIAILKFSSPSGLPILSPASSKVTAGEDVTAIGSPLGLKNTVSKGIVSAVREEKDGDTIQITAPISPGSSGGAAFNSNGDVIGVTYAGFEGGQNLNLVIPIDNVEKVYESRAETPAEFSKINDLLPIINEGNQVQIEAYLAQRGKRLTPELIHATETIFSIMDVYLEAMHRQGQYGGSPPFENIKPNEYSDIIRIADTLERDEVQKYKEKNVGNSAEYDLYNFPRIQDSITIVKVSSEARVDDLLRRWSIFETATGGSPDFVEYTSMGTVGDYAYKIECNNEDVDYYLELITLLAS